MRVIKDARLPHGLSSISLKCVLFHFVSLRASLIAYFSINRGQYASSAIQIGAEQTRFTSICCL